MRNLLPLLLLSFAFVANARTQGLVSPGADDEVVVSADVDIGDQIQAEVLVTVYGSSDLVRLQTATKGQGEITPGHRILTSGRSARNIRRHYSSKTPPTRLAYRKARDGLTQSART